MTGRFVAFEGGDGAGKSTQVALLADHLARAGRAAVLTRQPGGTPLGGAIRDLLLHGEHVSPRAEALLFAADKAHHVDTLIRPALERGEWVVTDRYVDSSIAYQGAGRALGEGEIADLQRWAVGGLMPDLTVLVDVPAEVAAGRRGTSPDRMESAGEGFHAAVRRHFLALAAEAPERYLVVDGTLPPEEIHDQVRQRLAGWLS